MRFSHFLVLMTLVTSCSTQKLPTVATVDSPRAIASQSNGIQYPAAYTYRMSDIQGVTYISFLKARLKPNLDKFSSGFDNIGSAQYKKNAEHLNPRTLSKYRGSKWNRSSRRYEGGLTDAQVETIFDSLKTVKSQSNVDSLCYFDRDDKSWPTKNHMSLAIKHAKVNSSPFDLCTLYALTGGIGVKVKIDDNNYNYHVLYKTGKTNPHEEVMSGRSFASSVGRGVADATDPEYLKDLQEYLTTTNDQKPFYRALILALANSETNEWNKLSNLGQAVLGDFFTVYTAEAVRHLMVDLKNGVHPWEIDLAAVTAVSAVSAKLGKVVSGGKLVNDDLGAWFAPSPNNKEGGPQRSGIGITRRDRKKFQAAIHKYEFSTPDGRDLIKKMQKIVGDKYNQDDIIQAVFEFLSNKYTPEKMGPGARELAQLFAEFIEEAREDAPEIAKLLQ